MTLSGGVLLFPTSSLRAQSTAPAEKEAFEAAKALGTVEAWDAFLSNYPKGFHADLARAYVKQLAGQQPAAPASPPSAAEPMQMAFENSCAGANAMRSNESKEPAKIRFINNSGAVRVIQWIDFNGTLKEYGTLQPGAEMTLDTFITHPWIAAYAEGSCRQVFLPAPGLSVARLLPDNQLPALSAPSSATNTESEEDHGPTPVDTCKQAGMDYNGRECVPRKSQKTSKSSTYKREQAACREIGMIYLKGKCAPKLKSERDRAAKNKKKACPAGMYRNPYGVCQPNETGS